MLTLDTIGGSTSYLTASNVDTLAAQYKASLSTPETAWKNQQTSITARLSVLATLRSKLSALSDTAGNLASAGSLSSLKSYNATSSNASVLSATVDSTADVAAHAIQVSQLAKNDIVYSNRITSGATSIADATGAGTMTFHINVNSVDTPVNVAIKAGDTNKTILDNIVTAINGTSSGVRAFTVADTATTEKLVISGSATGTSNAIVLSDTSGALLAGLGLSASVLTNRTASTATNGGYANSDSSKLDAKFNVDGIDIVRETNSVNDVIKGVTLNLAGVQSATDQPVTLSVGANEDAIKSEINQFISNYNDALSYLNAKTSIDPTTYVRQILAGDAMFNGLRYDMRVVVGGVVSGLPQGDPTMLADIGITAGEDGTLSLSDSTKLETALSNGPGKVAALFNSSTGIAKLLQTKLDTFVNVSGALDRETDSLNDQMTYLTTRIKNFDARVSVQVDKYRRDLQTLIATLTEMQQQQSTLSMILG